LTEHQRNQLLLERADLEEKISAEKDKQTRATIDASLGAVRDQQERIKEAREIAGLERQLQSGRFSGQQQEIARLRLAEITFEQQKRALDIQKDIKDAGGRNARALSGAPVAKRGRAAARAPTGGREPVIDHSA
jgi:ribosome-binding protein aMBF1 (putative translation factor)